jgi:hypothetical protein
MGAASLKIVKHSFIKEIMKVTAALREISKRKTAQRPSKP